MGIPLLVLGQTKIAAINFETPGGYTTNIVEFTDWSEDYFIRTDGTNIAPAMSFGNIQGGYYFAAHDIDGEGASLPVVLTIEGINISDYIGLEFRVYLAEDDDGLNEDWDAEDYVHFKYDIDNSGTFSDLLWIEGSGASNTTPKLDTNFDSIGDGTEISSTFTQFIESISGTGMLLDIEIEFYLNGGDEDIVIDNIEVWGISTCVPSHTITNFTPTSGPENTHVTIKGTGFTLGSSVQINEISATILSRTTTELVVEIPEGISSGKIKVAESFCVVETVSNFEVIRTKSSSCEGIVSATDLFISEVTDATTGGLSYIEIFNATNTTINLNGYSIQIFSNGNITPSSTITLNNFLLGVNQVYVLAVGIVTTPTTTNTCMSIIGSNGEFANQTSGSAGINKKSNEHDFIGLFKSTTLIDAFGGYVNNSWMNSLHTPITGDRGFNFRRLNTATTLPNTTFDDSDWGIIDWVGSGASSCSTNDYSNIGYYLAGNFPYVLTQLQNPPACSNDAQFSVSAVEGFSGGKSLTYQWLEATPGSALWTSLSDTGIYSGTNTNTFTISDTTTLEGYQYYCQVREDDANCYQVTNSVAISTLSSATTWDGISWSNGVPTSNSSVILAGDYSTSTNGNIQCCSLTINNNVIVEVDGTNNYLSIESDLVVNDGVILNVQTDASLVMVYDYGAIILNGTGIINVNKNSTPYEKFDYTYWSSPIVDATVGAALSGSELSRVYYYNGANFYDVDGDGYDDNQDDWVRVGTSHIMKSGRGYAAMASTSGIFAPTQIQNAVFSGIVNNGVITEAIAINNSPTASEFDYNLVGNPYPSAIDADEFIYQNPDISGTLYFWTHVDDISALNPGPRGRNFSPDDYASYNLTGGVATSNSSISGSNAPTGKIGSCQGFIVEAHKDGVVIFNNSMRSITHSNAQFFKLRKEKDRMWLNLTNTNGAFNQTLIGFFDMATDRFDNGYDGLLIGGSRVSIYTFIDGNAYTIQGKNTFHISDVVPLGFDTRIPEKLKIEIAKSEGVLSEIPIFLKDKKLNVLHDLTVSGYEFEMKTEGTYNDRFEIVFRDESKIEIEEDQEATQFDGLIISNEEDFILIQYLDTTLNTMTSVKAFDMLGRLIIDETSASNQFTIPSSNIKKGTILIFKIQLSNNEIVVRKFIKI